MSLISPQTMSDNENRLSLIVYIERLLLSAIPVLNRLTGASAMPAIRFHVPAALAAVASIALLGGCSGEPAGPPKSPYEVLQGKISKEAVSSMARADYGKTYARLGARQFDNANALMPWAAIAAAESDQCDRVELVAVSDKATRKELQWFVDCANKERFQIKQAQAEAARGKYDPAASPEAKQAAQQVGKAEPKSARWKDFNMATAMNSCTTLVRSAMLNQGSFDTAWSYDSEQNDDTGIVTIQQDFEAQNGFGGTISSRYHCEIDTKLAGRVTKLKIREPSGWRSLI